MNTYDWLATMDIRDNDDFDLVEVSFKNGSRKSFYHNPPFARAIIGDMVVVEAANGYDVGHISLTGELVRLQMKKKKVASDGVFQNIIRIANERDLEKLREARSLEQQTMVRSRVIARTIGLDMKIGDVEYQGDKRKATFYYTAEGRVDFRELIRQYAKEFRVKIEMRQIGARQESARIGGLGSCGRELCCSTWLTDFKSVSTAAARYQNLAINQSKLSGQCGRLKCCLNYELDTYMDALEGFPKKADVLRTEVGKAVLIKTDIFKGLLFYAYTGDNVPRGQRIHTLTIERVNVILDLNRNGQKPTDLVDLESLLDDIAEPEADYNASDLVGVIELPPEERKRRKKRRNNNKRRGNNRSGGGGSKNNNKNKPPAKNKGDQPKKGQGPNAEANKDKPNKPNRNKKRRGRGGNRNKKKGPDGPKKD